jgi:hypothetical protein
MQISRRLVSRLNPLSTKSGPVRRSSCKCADDSFSRWQWRHSPTITKFTSIICVSLKRLLRRLLGGMITLPVSGAVQQYPYPNWCRPQHALTLFDPIRFLERMTFIIILTPMPFDSNRRVDGHRKIPCVANSISSMAARQYWQRSAGLDCKIEGHTWNRSITSFAQHLWTEDKNAILTMLKIIRMD